jgi:hypothetical protein
MITILVDTIMNMDLVHVDNWLSLSVFMHNADLRHIKFMTLTIDRSERA